MASTSGGGTGALTAAVVRAVLLRWYDGRWAKTRGVRAIRRGLGRLGLRAMTLLLLMAGLATAPATAQDQRPYDDRLFRLAEILGAVHYLREVCGGNDGQLWRDRMQDLLNAEGSSALRRVRLTRTFNQSWSNYRRTYSTCTPSAEGAITKFLNEGAQIAETLVKTIP